MTQKKRILQILKQRPMYNYEFFRLDPPILRGSERVRELIAEGYDIRSRKTKRKGVWEYKLYKEVDTRGMDWEADNIFDAVRRPDLKVKAEQLGLI